MQAFRYTAAGALVRCEDMGPVFREVEMRPAPLLFVGACPERRISVGIMAADLRREAAMPGGPPTWFRPNASRRRRWTEWSRTPRKARREMAPVPPFEPLPVRTLVGHPFRAGKGHDVLLYLPEGEHPTERHGRDLDRALRGAA